MEKRVEKLRAYARQSQPPGRWNVCRDGPSVLDSDTSAPSRLKTKTEPREVYGKAPATLQMQRHRAKTPRRARERASG
jgi:hypothetical protein